MASVLVGVAEMLSRDHGEWLSKVLLVLEAIVVCFAVVAVAMRARRLAMRLPDPRLAFRTAIVTGGLLSTASLLVAGKVLTDPTISRGMKWFRSANFTSGPVDTIESVASVLFFAFLLLTFALVDRYRESLRAAAQQARGDADVHGASD